jgi:hypothetical protein
MSYTASSARQRVRAAVQRVTYADLTSGVAFNIFTNRKNGRIPLKIEVVVITPFNSATSDVLDLGLAGGSEYANDLDLKSAAGTHLPATTVPGYVNDASGGLQLTGKWVGVGAAPTAGEFLVIEQYVVDGHEDFSEG